MLGLLLDDLKLVAESLPLDDLKLIAKSRGIEGYKNMSEKRLLSALSKPKIDNERLKKIREDLNKSRHKFSKSEIKEIRKNLYEIESKKNLSTQKIKEIEKSLSALKKYYDHDDAKYIGIRDVGNLFNQSADKDYYKPIKTKSAFNGNYIEYESNGDKDKSLSEKEYLSMIRPYLSNIINDHKIHSGNEVIDYETQFEEWKIQLTMSINFIFSKDSDDTRNMHTKSNNIEIMAGSETDEIIEEHSKSLLQRYQEELEESMKGNEFIFDSVNLLRYYLQKEPDHHR